MADRKADTTIAHQVELTIGRLDSLSILPCVAAQIFPKLYQGRFSPSAVADIIESEPALAAKILSLISKQGVILPEERFSLRQGLDRLAIELVREILFSAKVLPVLEDDEQTEIRKQLMLHNLAVACCAKDIAEIMLPQTDSGLAYCAGLLHDIGKFALIEAMPKSYVRIVEEAQSQSACSCDVEKKHLGTDHTVLGKRLAGKWHLPEAIILAIWLHHSDTVRIYQDMSEGRIAAIVQLADSLARQSGIGQSGSYDSPQQIQPIANLLGIDLEQLSQLQRGLPEQVQQKSKVLGLDMPNALSRYAEAVHTSTIQLVRDNAKLSGENLHLQTAASYLDFITEFLLGISPAAEAIDIAEDFARRWQKFYQTGKVCLYLAPQDSAQILEAVVVESLLQSKVVGINIPAEIAPIPEAIVSSFAILEAQDYLDWLFEQLDVDFDSKRTKVMPILSGRRAMGVIAFELHWPGDIKLFEEKFRVSTSVAGAILDMAFAWQRQQRLAERFVQLTSRIEVGQPKETSILRSTTKDESYSLLSGLAEMAAGAAHELNNPLSIISGRAQMLTDAETDKEKRQLLQQIRENANEIAGIIDDLMSFAEPLEPRPTKTNINQILDEAVQLTSQKIKAEHLNIQVEVSEDARDVFVDSGQVVSAIANIITNAVESYTDEPHKTSGLLRGKLGLVRITAGRDKSSGFVRLTISDLGCGMDAETLRKATYPLFSSKPAGRKRGMGLAQAVRFIEINGGSLQIASKLGEGTAVTILLPNK